MIDYSFNPFTGNLDETFTLGKVQFTGNDCTGIDGDTNRVLNTGVNPIQIFSDGMFIPENIDCMVSGNLVTFLISIFDSQKITVFY